MKRPLTKHIGTFLQAAIAGAWPGVDESVVEHYAKQAGHPASKPLFGLQGDLLLFLFLLAGLIAGFIIGYYWRALFKSGVPEAKMRTIEYTVQEPGVEKALGIQRPGAGGQNEEQGITAYTSRIGPDVGQPTGLDDGVGYEK